MVKRSFLPRSKHEREGGAVLELAGRELLPQRAHLLVDLVQGSGFRMQGLGFRVQGSGFRV